MNCYAFVQRGRFCTMPEGFYEPFEDELEAIRLNLYERTKHMTVEEKVVYLQPPLGAPSPERP